MTNKTSTIYKLHIQCIDQVVWARSRFKKSPNLYVEVRLEQIVRRTRTVKRSMTPVWDEEIPIVGNDSSTLSLLVKHRTLMPCHQDPCVGSVDITVSHLLQMCENNQDAVLELGPKGGGTDKSGRGFITIRLKTSGFTQMGALAISNARQDVQEVVGAAVGAVSQPGDFTTALGNVCSKLDTFVLIMDKASRVHPYAYLAWQVTASLYKVIRGQIERDNKIIALVMTMESVYSFVDAVQSLPNKLQLLEDVIADILKQTVECMIFIREYTGRGFASRVAGQTFSSADQVIKNLSDHLIALKQSFDSGIALQTVFVSTRMSDGVETLVKIENLKLLNPVQMDASLRPECLPNTRQDILKFITGWLTAPSDGQNILWLYGVAGSGKSTISTTIAEYFRELGRLGAFLFFDRNDPTGSKPSGVIRTLSYKLACFDPAIKTAVCQQIERDSSISEAATRVQFAKLLREPLAFIPGLHNHGPIIIILDGFDECGDPASRRSLLALFAQEWAKLPPVFRFLITSRRIPDLEAAFLDRPNIMVKELDTADQAKSDISVYIHHHMGTFRGNKSFKLAPDWPGEQVIQQLVQLSDGLFIWASTAIGFIDDAHHPQRRLKLLLSSQSRRKAETGLDLMYKTALEVAGKWDDDEVAEDFRAILGAIVVARIPLSDTALDQMLGLDEDQSSSFILSRLHCLLQWSPGQPVRTLHASFADYLTGKSQCGTCPWFIDTSIHDRNLAVACLQTMKAGLRFNICELETSHLPNNEVPDLQTCIDDCIPNRLSYACRFWADHLQNTVFEPDILLCLDNFLVHQLLYWLEVLSLIKEIPTAISALQSAAHWALDHNEDLSRLASDAVTFVSTFRYPMSESAPHIYVSAVPLAPVGTRISKQFLSHIPQHISVTMGKVADWPTSLNVLEGHTGRVSSVAFSPNGQHIVSGSDDHTVRVWDAKTGEMMAEPFEGHTHPVSSVAFSPNGQQIVSGSNDHTVRVWDTKTGEVTAGPLEGHTHMVSSVAFSPNGQQIVSGSWDHTMCVWDAKTGEVMVGPFKGQDNWIRSVAFSPDSQQIVSGSDDATVCVWDANTGKLMAGPFEGHSMGVRSVAFSPDGQQIVSGSEDHTVCVWGTKTGKMIAGPFKGHAGQILSVAFSPDGQQIVSGSADHTVCVLDAKTGVVMAGPFEEHTSMVESVTFSSDGQQVISGSADQTMRVWDVKMGEVISGKFEGHRSRVMSVAFSSSGQQIVSGSDDHTVCVWDAKTAEMVAGPFDKHTSAVYCVAFSPDDQQVASGSVDCAVYVWDVKMGEVVAGPFEGHTGPVQSIAFSPDGKQIVSGSDDQTVCMWDAKTGGMMAKPFQQHESWVMSVAFSSDGQQIVSGSWDKTMYVWDAKSGEVMAGPFKGHTEGVLSVAFSPDGQQVVSGSEDHTVCVWDAKTGKMTAGPFIGHIEPARTVAFSPDGKQIVSGSHDHTVCVWDAKSGEVVAGPFEGHTGWVWSVAFSPDGQQIVSCSDDKTVRVWDVKTGEVAAGSSVVCSSPVTYYPSPKDTSAANLITDITQGTVAGHVDHSFKLVNGWVKGRDEELLFWLPPYYRFGLWGPSTVAVISRKVTKLDFGHFVHGESWAQCHSYSNN